MFFLFFFFNGTATTEIYTLSLHDALPICLSPPDCCRTCVSSCASSLLPSRASGANFPSPNTTSDPTVKASASTERAAAPASCPECTRTAPKSEPSRSSIDARTPGSSGRPACSRTRSTAGVLVTSPASATGPVAARRCNRSARQRAHSPPPSTSPPQAQRRGAGAIPLAPSTAAAFRSASISAGSIRPRPGALRWSARRTARLPAARWRVWTPCCGGRGCTASAVRAGSSVARSATASKRPYLGRLCGLVERAAEAAAARGLDQHTVGQLRRIDDRAIAAADPDDVAEVLRRAGIRLQEPVAAVAVDEGFSGEVHQACEKPDALILVRLAQVGAGEKRVRRVDDLLEVVHVGHAEEPREVRDVRAQLGDEQGKLGSPPLQDRPL